MNHLEDGNFRGLRIEIADVSEAAETLVSAVRDATLKQLLLEAPTPDIIRRVYTHPRDDYDYIPSFTHGIKGLAEALSSILLLVSTRPDAPSPEELREWLKGNVGDAKRNKNNATGEFSNAIEIEMLLDKKLGTEWRQSDEFIWRLRDRANISQEQQDILSNAPNRRSFERPLAQQQAKEAIDEFCETFVQRMVSAIASLNTPAMQLIGLNFNTASLGALGNQVNQATPRRLPGS